MLLLVGLGNPGPGHAKNRHNLGYLTVDEIVRLYSFGPWRHRFHGSVSEGRLAGRRIIVLKPETYMNLSGQSVASALRYYRLESEKMIVIHDELDLPPGKVRVKKGGGNAGHNGLRSLDSHVGRDYRRVRIGVGHPGMRDVVGDYLLHDFSKSDRRWVTETTAAIADAIEVLVVGDVPGFMNKVSLATQPPKPKRPPPDNHAGEQ